MPENKGIDAGSVRRLRDVVKHSAMYGVAQVISRMSSLLLLPIYTRYLVPSDYGVIAILDISASLLGLLIGAGISAAVNRYHFEATNEGQRSAVWYTGASLVFVSIALLLVILLPSVEFIAPILLTKDVAHAETLVLVAAVTLAFSVFGDLNGAYWVANKWSGRVAVFSIVRLLVNASLNLWFLIGLELGVLGILLGNLITSGLGTATVTMINVRALGRPRLQLDLVPGFCRFGLPLVLTDFITFLLLRSDQYFVRAHSTLDALGLYSLADMMAMGFYALLITPFIRTWQALTFEIAELPEANHEYSKFFEGFVYCFAVAFLAAALLSDVIVRLLVSDAFYAAAQLMPVLLLAYFFFALRIHFTVPSVLAKRTSVTLIPTGCAAVVCLLGNAVVVPMFGAPGAAWVKVIGMLWLAVHLLIVNRRLREIDYNALLSTGIVLLCVVLVVATEWLADAFVLSLLAKAVLSSTSLLIFTSVVTITFALRYPAVVAKFCELARRTAARIRFG